MTAYHAVALVVFMLLFFGLGYLRGAAAERRAAAKPLPRSARRRAMRGFARARNQSERRRRRRLGLKETR